MKELKNFIGYNFFFLIYTLLQIYLIYFNFSTQNNIHIISIESNWSSHYPFEKMLIFFIEKEFWYNLIRCKNLGMIGYKNLEVYVKSK